MNRRKFINHLSSTATLPLLPDTFYTQVKKAETPALIKPPSLKPGDTIGLVTPATFLTETELRQAEEKLHTLGLKVYYSPNMLVRKGHLAGTDEQRAADLNQMFAQETVDGIWCGRGGYGSARILPLLDYDLIRHNPKPFIGYSDITSLHYGIHARTGLVTFHGPVAKEMLNPFAERYLREVLMEETSKIVYRYEAEDPAPVAPIKPAAVTAIENDQMQDMNRDIPRTITPGIAEGPLVGGNLSLVTALSGTSYDIDMRDKIVFLEDVGESPARLDRMLTQLLLTEDKLPSAAGVVLGIFTDCEPEDPEKSFSLREILFDRLSVLGVPVVYGLPFGHIKRNITLPFGVQARLDATAHTLTLLEKPVL